MKNRAFTLIELLVVVLIIGILAAIALPQYQKAVMRTRYNNLKSLTRRIADAEEVFYMANNTYSVDFEELDVDMPGGKLDSSTAEYYQYDWGACELHQDTEERAWVHCNNDLINMTFQVRLQHSLNPGRHTCLARGSTDPNTLQAQICKAETGLTTPSYSSSAEGNIYTSWQY